MAGPTWLDGIFGVLAKFSGSTMPRRAVWEFTGAGVTSVEDVPTSKLTRITIGGVSGGADIAVADTAALRAVAAESRTDKQLRLVESKGAPERFDADVGANEGDDGELVTKPTDVAGASAGRWYPVGTRRAIGTALLASVFASNPEPAAAGAQQYSPAVRLTGQGWKTDAAAASQPVEFALQCRPVQGAAAPTGDLHWLSQINGGGWASLMSLSSFGVLSIGTLAFSGGASPVYSIRSDATSFALSWAQDPSAAGGALTIAGQQGAPGFIGGQLILQAGYGGTPGTNLAGGVKIDLGTENAGNVTSELSIWSGPTKAADMRGFGSPGNGLWIRSAGQMLLEAVSGGVELRAGVSCVIRSGGALTALVSGNTSGTPTWNWQGTGEALIRSDAGAHNGAFTVTWASTITSVTHGFTDRTTASTAAAPLELRAQTTTGATSAGGAMILRAGDGTLSGGKVQLHCGKDTVGTNHGAFEIWNRGYSNDNPQVEITKTDASFKITGQLVLGDAADKISLNGAEVDLVGVGVESSATAGAAAALPATPATYFYLRVNGVNYVVPAYESP